MSGGAKPGGDQPAEQQAYGSELLLHARRRVGVLAGLDIGGDADRPDRTERAPPVFHTREKVWHVRV